MSDHCFTNLLFFFNCVKIPFDSLHVHFQLISVSKSGLGVGSLKIFVTSFCVKTLLYILKSAIEPLKYGSALQLLRPIYIFLRDTTFGYNIPLLNVLYNSPFIYTFHSPLGSIVHTI